MRTTYAAAALLSLSILWGCTTTESQEKADLIILQMNDVYEIAPLEGGKVGGLARVATLKQQLESEAPVITILSGDFLSPSLTGTLEYEGKKIAGRQMVESLNALGLDYVTFGNHEFDLKEPDLLARIDESDFTWISTNTFHVTHGDTLPFTQKGAPLPRSVVHSIPLGEDTLRLAFIGICLPFTLKPFVYYNTEYRQVVSQELAKLNDQPHIPLAITHLNIADDERFAQNNPEFPLIMGGHDHDSMRVAVNDSYIIKADANAKSVAVHRLWYQEDGTVEIKTDIIPITNQLAEEPEVLAVINKWQGIADAAMLKMGYNPTEVLIHTDSVLDGRESIIRNEPSYLGTLTCDAMLYADTSFTDLAVFNSGSIRLDDQIEGTVTMYDVLRTYPYGGPIKRTTMTGADLQIVLNNGRANKGSGGYLQTTQVQYTGSTYLIRGDTLEPDKEYSLFVTDYMSGGKESNLEILKDFTYQYDTATVFRNATKNDLRDVVASYMKYLESEK
ncbi:MAG TPA: bifunctional metallophosphatase/5'-nucleotidase [Cytophagales bacterium]|nr:bifunctional metallophosphatase/5'-nucleotidase [Cytophagales bacterium]HAA24404.1 bifunctional metallophosphatase/5'-nucleotidase [Cytophagales bacterium]HAP59692.1 bifunctional metallophosphatase/5'-nucleotidase [Cytophagales bacterium]